ncbi:hypothetical protein [Fluviispira multicolorata]|uniref:Uncharacterized protein n=1 Tax=Fluviispira multicolorata TaxID=2654512 RepID=A0A833JF14_9BACT|nr:hypothetical protein [Fluviispira multicolorata]KAB8032209.1 hypothetical protein GCL57_06060 [Fluviispira multicolorata]
MNLFFDLDYISSLVLKIEHGNVSYAEHSYLQKVIAAQTVINEYQKDNNIVFQKIYLRYYSWLSLNWQKNSNSPREKTDHFLLKNALEKRQSILMPKKDNIYQKPLNHFSVLLELARIWNQPLKQERNSILNFLMFFLERVYGIPKQYIDTIFSLLEESWKPILSPLGVLPNRKFSLQEIEEYFFGNKLKPEYSVQVIPKIDRYFSIIGKEHRCHLFLPKSENFDLFEAALVIHEFQHLLDIDNYENILIDNKKEIMKDESYSKFYENLFLSEKNALNAERVFILGLGAAKRGRFCWLESNLFYPILLLKCELNNLLYGDKATIDFSEMCLKHGMEPLPLSALFEWGAPFQLSAYCAAAMDLEQGWQKFLQ